MYQIHHSWVQESLLGFLFPCISAVRRTTHTLYNYCSYNKMSDGEKQRRRISDAFIPFPSSFKRNYKRSKVNRVWQYCSCSEILPQATCNINFMDDTEPKREFEKYPQVKLLILAERVLVTVDPLRQGHGVKTQHWNWALINSSNDLSPHESLGWTAPSDC